jgi:hypothetical protein
MLSLCSGVQTELFHLLIGILFNQNESLCVRIKSMVMNEAFHEELLPVQMKGEKEKQSSRRDL